MDICSVIRQELFELQDTGYKEFHQRLIPNIEPDRIIGVRTPILRKYAKQCAKLPDIDIFLNQLPHTYYEENNLHAFIIETIKDYDTCMEKVQTFLPYIDNWATCDSFSPKVFKKHLPELLDRIKVWIDSDEEYTVRYGVGMLMGHFLDEEFKTEHLDMVVNIKSELYYINMMRAWYIATALAKQYNAALPYIVNQRLDNWTHNKAIQKAVESNRISAEQKKYLRQFKL